MTQTSRSAPLFVEVVDVPDLGVECLAGDEGPFEIGNLVHVGEHRVALQLGVRAGPPSAGP